MELTKTFCTDFGGSTLRIKPNSIRYNRLFFILGVYVILSLSFLVIPLHISSPALVNFSLQARSREGCFKMYFVGLKSKHIFNIWKYCGFHESPAYFLCARLAHKYWIGIKINRLFWIPKYPKDNTSHTLCPSIQLVDSCSLSYRVESFEYMEMTPKSVAWKECQLSLFFYPSNYSKLLPSISKGRSF